jgi:TatD DNase family protein
MMAIHKMIDSHIHLDQYREEDIPFILNDPSLESLIAVSYHLESCKRNLQLSNVNRKIKLAFGWHPEQELLEEQDLTELLAWMNVHSEKMIAVGEVGLPYYMRKDLNKSDFPSDMYVKILEKFMNFAKKEQKPIILHAVYEDASLVCDLLESYSINKAHFHWFKGDSFTIERMIHNGYLISVTPDVLYEVEIQELVKAYPLKQIMVETDGPWPFEGPFRGKQTHPAMIHSSIKQIAQLKNLTLGAVYDQLYQNTKNFYQI